MPPPTPRTRDRLRTSTGLDTTMAATTMVATTRTAVATEGGAAAVGWTAGITREVANSADLNLGNHQQSTARPFLFRTRSALRPNFIPIFNGFTYEISNSGSQRVAMSPFAYPKILVFNLWTQARPGAARVTCDNCGIRGHLEKSCMYRCYGPIYLWWMQQAIVHNRQDHSGS